MGKIDEILKWLEEYKNKTHCRGVVLGLSGGKDSTVVAMLAKKVWGDNVFAVLMPNGEQKDIQDSLDIANTLELNYTVANINKIYNELLNTTNISISDKAKTNIPPRIRMTLLYAIAQSFGYRVIGTGNASEAFIGWTTKWGDSACDFNPIAHLTCTEVMEIGKELAKEFGLNKKFVTKTPNDGLSGKSDEENFGFSYKTLDSCIKGNVPIPTEIKDKYLMSEHKRRMPYTIKDNFD